MKFKNKVYALMVLLSTQNVFAAANFSVTPFGVVPTTITPGQTVAAYYILNNLTNFARNGYSIQGLPATVRQNTTSPHCPGTINLPAHASCLLQFDITGPVSANFALCKGSSCTTATSPLNVSTSTASAPTPAKFIYVINAYNTPAVSVCSLDATSGAVLSCQDAGGQSTFASIPLSGIAINNLNTVAYMSNGNGSSTTPFVYQCQIDPTTHLFGTCSTTTVTSPTNYTPYEGMLGINSTSTLAFLTDNTARVLACPIAGNVMSANCVDTGATPISSNVVSVAVNKAGTTAYIGNYNSPVGVNVCAANGSTFSGCVNKTGGSVGGTPFSFQSVGGVALNYKEDTLYIADSNSHNIYACATTPSGATTFGNCYIANSANSAYNVVINATNTVAYLSDFGTNLYSCPILSDGTFPTCTQTTLPGATVGMALLY